MKKKIIKGLIYLSLYVGAIVFGVWSFSQITVYR